MRLWNFLQLLAVLLFKDTRSPGILFQKSLEILVPIIFGFLGIAFT